MLGEQRHLSRGQGWGLRSIEGLLMRLDSNRFYLDVFELRMPQHTCIRTHTHTHIHNHSCTITHIFTHAHTYGYVMIRAHTRTLTRTYTHTHTAFRIAGGYTHPSQTHLPVKFAPHQENVQESQFTCSGSHWVIHWDARW